MHKKKLRVSTSSSLHNNNDESDSSSATANANKRLTNISHDLKSSNIRLKAQVASLLNLSNLLLKSSSSGKTLGMVKADAIAFSSILDSNVIQLLGPSPASVNLAGGGESSKDSKGKSLNLDLIGGEDNACVGEVMNFFKGMQTGEIRIAVLTKNLAMKRLLTHTRARTLKCLRTNAAQR
jgi:hypothetical protein